jgi:hypothetical protein
MSPLAPRATPRRRVGHDRDVATRGELSSLTSTLEEVTSRITSLAESANDAGDAELATELFAVERALRGALRRLARQSAPG